MSAYRFCRTDDIGLLVDALNRCWAPHFPAEPPMTPAAFKRWIRDLQVWCSSCMVAFSDADPIGVLIGAKRASGTLIHRIAIHPDHLRQGHGRHLLTSLSSKLAILGPPRLVAEVPETNAVACALFSACGYAMETSLTDFVLDAAGSQEIALGVGSWKLGVDEPHGFVIPVTVDDLAANDLLASAPPVCWQRSVETLTARKDEISGLAIASDERIEACVLVSKQEGAGSEILLLRSFVEDGEARLGHLLSQLLAQGPGSFIFPKVQSTEFRKDLLENLGFRSVGAYRLYSAKAQAA